MDVLIPNEGAAVMRRCGVAACQRADHCSWESRPQETQRALLLRQATAALTEDTQKWRNRHWRCSYQGVPPALLDEMEGTAGHTWPCFVIDLVQDKLLSSADNPWAFDDGGTVIRLICGIPPLDQGRGEERTAARQCGTDDLERLQMEGNFNFVTSGMPALCWDLQVPLARVSPMAGHD